MISEHWIAIWFRTLVALATMVSFTGIKPAVVRATNVPGSDLGRQVETAAEATESSEHRNRFYLRAGASLDLSSNTRFGDNDCLSTSPAALYGCGKGNNGTSLGAQGDFGRAAGVEVGLGFGATPKLRMETSITYRPQFAFKGSANFVQTSADQPVSGDLWSTSGMVVAYMDLYAYGPVRLFAGSGAGLHFVDISNFRMTFPRTETIVPDGRNVDFSVMLTAGLATSLTDKITLDLAWRYVDWGIVETGRATGQVVWNDGRREPLEINLAETRAMRQEQGFWTSLRYAF